MYVGDCSNGAKFVKCLPHEINKLAGVLPFEENETNKLLLDIITKRRGNVILQSGYAVMWQWGSSPTTFYVIVWKELGGSSQGNVKVNKVREL